MFFFRLKTFIKNLIEIFPLQFNQILDSLKFKNLHLCIAKRLNKKTNRYSIPCKKYTKYKYCSDHAKKLPLDCDEYHFVRRYYQGLERRSLVECAIEELKLRSNFIDQYSIVSDKGHLQRINVLNNIILTDSLQR